MPHPCLWPALWLLAVLILSAGGCNGLMKDAYRPAELTTVTTDGWTISMYRYKPDGPQATPVILCHGLSYNGRFWDLADEVSLARYLRQAGYDVWVPSLRGAGASTKPPLSRLRQLFLRGDLLTAGDAFTSGGRGILKTNWTVDDHAKYDVPAILDFVCKTTGRDRAYWVGHSMGGMVMVAYLDQNPAEQRVAGFAAMAVPVYIVPPPSAPLKQLADARGAVQISNAMGAANLPAVLAAITGGSLPTPIDVLFYNSANITPDTVRRLSAWATEEISPGQLSQLIDMIATGKFTSADGKVDYTAGLDKIKVPGLFCVGTVDNLATVESVKELYAKWGASDRRFELFGVVNGQKSDYGHDDLVIGRQSKQDVYPVVRDWLDAHSGVQRIPVLGIEAPRLGGAK